MTKCAHVLLTKFNVALSEFPEGRPGLNADWLAQRLELFSEWTLPSVRRQTVRPTSWLILTDAATPTEYLDALRALTAGTATILPLVGTVPDARIGELVRATLPASVETLITSRIDSDDALAVGYLAAVGTQASNWRGFINAPHGIQFSDEAVLRRYDRRGPFLSMIEDLSRDRQPRTAFCVEHYRADSVAPVRQMTGQPMWIQVVHGENLANRMSGLPYPRGRAEAALGWPLPPARGKATSRELAQAAYLEARLAVSGPLHRMRSPSKGMVRSL